MEDQAVACLTGSRVVARISIDVTTPLPERKFDGVFQIVTEFSPMASPAFEIGRYVIPRSQITQDLQG
jgi:exosome complex RNA-binding protein Rrp42 (RNase PH superfamily)